jgi:cytochrome P450
MFGGKEKTWQYFDKQNKSDWASKLAKPAGGDLEKAFNLFVESNEHGDPHSLLKDWNDQLSAEHGGPVNYILPFLRINLWNGKQEATPHLWVVINNPEDHMRIVEDNPGKSPMFGATNYGNNFLAHVDNKEWRRRRFGLIFAVSPRANETYFHKMERHAHMLIDKFMRAEGGQFTYGQTTPEPCFNVHSMIEHTAFSIAADCLYDADDDMINEWSQKIRWALQNTRAGDPVASKILNGWTNALMSRPIPEGMNGPLLQGLHEVKEDYNKDDHPQSAIMGDVSILTIAMHDTTASTMSFCLTELARRPALQDALYVEVTKVLANKQNGGDTMQRPMTYDDLYEMPLLTKVLNETLRLYPAVSYGTQRELEKDTWLTVGPQGSTEKVLVPKGTNVMCHNFSNHRNKELWGEDANEWKPERWEGYGDIDAINFDGPDGEDGWRTAYSARNPQSLRFHPFTRAPRQCFVSGIFPYF